MTVLLPSVVGKYRPAYFGWVYVKILGSSLNVRLIAFLVYTYTYQEPQSNIQFYVCHLSDSEPLRLLCCLSSPFCPIRPAHTDRAASSILSRYTR